MFCKEKRCGWGAGGPAAGRQAPDVSFDAAERRFRPPQQKPRGAGVLDGGHGRVELGSVGLLAPSDELRDGREAKRRERRGSPIRADPARRSDDWGIGGQAFGLLSNGPTGILSQVPATEEDTPDQWSNCAVEEGEFSRISSRESPAAIAVCPRA